MPAVPSVFVSDDLNGSRSHSFVTRSNGSEQAGVSGSRSAGVHGVGDHDNIRTAKVCQLHLQQ